MIRKLSLGRDYKDAMHYTVGQSFGRNTIDAIRQVHPEHYEIFIQDEDGNVFVWKSIVNMPVVIEYDIKGF